MSKLPSLGVMKPWPSASRQAEMIPVFVMSASKSSDLQQKRYDD
jgi:hypothetical protein